MEKWFIKNKQIDYRIIAKRLGIHEIISKLLVNRDIHEDTAINMFLDPQLDKLHSPKLMKDLTLGTDLLNDKIKSNKKIRIVGDFDVDGVMSVYILYKGLKRLGANVDYIIPDRVMDGYGINLEIVQAAKDDNVDTIITCDNGISALEQIKFAKELGLTVIVTDHHDIPYIEENDSRTFICPEGDAIINPKQLECQYPIKSLCGAGVAFKVINYLYKINNLPDEEVYEFLEFVAIATICDVVDLIDENRIMVKKGLEFLNNTNNIGLKALIEASGIKDKNISVYHIGFVIGPTINASGRLDSALYALELLLCKEEKLAKEIAINLREINEDRKKMTTEGIEKVTKQIELSNIKKDKVFVVYEPEIHESIAGIIAGRIKERYNRPTIVLTKGKDGVKGSGRSIEEYNMFEELSKCKDLLNKYGGHPMAAGLGLDEENINSLREALNKNTTLTDEDIIPKVYIDMQLPIDYISFKLIEQIKSLEPFGKGNSKPIFGEKKLKIIKGSILGAKKNVLKLNLLSSNGIRMEALYFGDNEVFLDEIKKQYGQEQLDKMIKGIDNDILIDIVYYPDVNEFNGRTTIQVIIKNYRLANTL